MKERGVGGACGVLGGGGKGAGTFWGGQVTQRG